MRKRAVDIVVLSDLHLGTIGCHAVELAQYLQSIEPEKLILNGDIFDIWNFKKYYWPKTHMEDRSLQIWNWLEDPNLATIDEIAEPRQVVEQILRQGVRSEKREVKN